MVPTKSRSRSNTAVSLKSRKRPESRASTTSIHSVNTQPILDQQFSEEQHLSKQWHENNTNNQAVVERFSHEHQMTPDHMMIYPPQHHPDPRQYGIDPALNAAVNQSLGYVQSGPRHSLPGDGLAIDGYGTSYVEDDTPMLEGRSDEQDDVDSMAGANGLSKKVSKSSAANEMEMRSLFANNKHRTLPEVARELHGNERGPQSERTRQVFAMLWLVLCLMLRVIDLTTLGSTTFVTKAKGRSREVVCTQTTFLDAPPSVSRC